ncbi:MAG: DUF4157 domain-containing protein [Blastocatellia bacterium]
MNHEQAQISRIPMRSSHAASGLLQRQCACGGHAGLTGECSECSSRRLTLQRRAADASSLTTVPPIVLDVLRSSGQPLDLATRALMESRFGHDFSQVRVHTDARAAESAQSVHALAYTVGRDVVFGAGQYAPQTIAGENLLAHELTHTIQQSAWAADTITPQHSIAIEPADSSLERAADENASRLAVNSVAPAPARALQRKPDEIEMPAEYAFALDERKRTDKNYAWAQGRKDAARIQQNKKFTPEDRKEIIAKLRFFQGEAKAAYIRVITPAVSEYAKDVADILAESNRPEVNPCDPAKQQYLLEYEDAPGKYRCMDIKTDPEYLKNLFDDNISNAVGFAVQGTTWENVQYGNFKVMLVKYKNGKSEYFMLDEVGNFYYGGKTLVLREFTFLKRADTGLLYPISNGRIYFSELLTPNILSLKNGLKYTVKELQDLYTLLETGGAFASIISTYAVVAGFKDSLEGFKLSRTPRPKTTEPETTTRMPGQGTDEPATTPKRTRTDEPKVSPTQTTTEPAKAPAKPKVGTQGEETHTTVSRTDEDPTGFKGGKKKPTAKQGGKQEEETSSKVSRRQDDEPEDGKGGRKKGTGDEPKRTTTAPKPQQAPDDPQRGVKDALERAKQRIARQRTEIESYNERIATAKQKEQSLRQQLNDTPRDDPGRAKIYEDWKKAKAKLDELTAQREVPIRQVQEDQAIQTRLQRALDAKTYERPGDFHAGVRDQVWQNALKEGKGKVLSPSGTEIKPGDPWVMGHKPKYEFWKHQRSAAERGISREQFIKEYNDPSHYRPETKKDNESHFYEDKTDVYLGH